MKSNLYFKHDLYALTDNKLRKLISMHGMGGYAVFFETVAILTRNDSHKYDLEELVNDLAYDLHAEAENVKGILLYAIENCGLFFLEDGCVFSQRVNDAYKEKEEFSRKQSEKGKKGMEKRWGNRNTGNDSDNSGYENDNSGYENDNSGYENDNQPITYKQEQEKNKEKENISNEIFPKKKCVENEVSHDLSTESGSLFPEDEKVETQKYDVPYKKIADYWNEKAKGVLPQIAKLTKQRKATIRQRWDEWHERVFEAIDKAVVSDWLTKKWGNCNFDWVFCPTNMVRILEGVYKNNKDSEKPSSKDYSKVTDEDLEKKFSWET